MMQKMMRRRPRAAAALWTGALRTGALLAALHLAAPGGAAQASEATVVSGACGTAMRLLVSFDAVAVSTRSTRGFARSEATRALRRTMRDRAYAAAMAAASSRCGGRGLAVEIEEVAAAPVCTRAWVRTIHGPQRGLECRVRGAQASAMAVFQ